MLGAEEKLHVTTRLADFYAGVAGVARVMIHHQILHALALAVGDEVVGGIAWNHTKDLNALLRGGVGYLAEATLEDFGSGNRETLAATMEQMARIWPATPSGGKESSGPG